MQKRPDVTIATVQNHPATSTFIQTPHKTSNL